MTNTILRPCALAALSLALAAACTRDEPNDNDVSVPFEFATDSGAAAVQTGTAAAAYYRFITPELVGAAPTQFPLLLPDEGPIVLHIQVLLDRANFSPGIVDGRWGINARNALHWFKVSYGLDTALTMQPPAGAPVPVTRADSARARTAERTRKTRGTAETDSPDSAVTSAAAAPKYSDSRAVIDKPTYDRLLAVGTKLPVIGNYTITPEDAAGPYLDVPRDVYAQGKLRCLCYESLSEALAERFHTTAELLAQLNSSISFDSVAVGTSILVPNVLLERPKRVGSIATIAISKRGFWTQARDSSGRIIHHFPSTLGAKYDPSPTGNLRVTNIAVDPSFHYQPTLFADVPDSRPETMLPPGPNSPVGPVWMALSKPHYGIHGTGSPETIGYANSHGCVRLTNWDARILAQMVTPGTPVEFF